MASPAQNANQKVKLILDKILEEYELGAGVGDLRLETKHFLKETGVDDDQFTRILRRLEKDFILESFVVHGNGADLVCLLKPLNHFKSRIEDYIERLGVDKAPKSNLGFILYLKGGDLSHGNEEDNLCYPMSATKDRLAMVKFMIENEGYQTTESIALALGKTEQNVRTEIAKIRAKIEHHLDLDDLIESEKGLGYRINPKYKITIIK